MECPSWWPSHAEAVSHARDADYPRSIDAENARTQCCRSHYVGEKGEGNINEMGVLLSQKAHQEASHLLRGSIISGESVDPHMIDTLLPRNNGVRTIGVPSSAYYRSDNNAIVVFVEGDESPRHTLGTSGDGTKSKPKLGHSSFGNGTSHGMYTAILSGRVSWGSGPLTLIATTFSYRICHSDLPESPMRPDKPRL